MAQWKSFERYIARIFNTTRNALSGGNSKMTRSDSIHPDLFISCKYTKANNRTLRKLVDEEREKATAERKIAVVISGEASDRSNSLVTIHLKDLEIFCRLVQERKVEVCMESVL